MAGTRGSHGRLALLLDLRHKTVPGVLVHFAVGVGLSGKRASRWCASCEPWASSWASSAKLLATVSDCVFVSDSV